MIAGGRLYVAFVVAAGLAMAERVGWFGPTPLHIIQALPHVLVIVACVCGMIAGVLAGLAVMAGVPLFIVFLTGKAVLWLAGPPARI